MTPISLELLAPAKNAEFGMAAIDHGADAVYIGGPAFGARTEAGNTVAEIARLADYAHRFHARVLVALNTILRDDELEAARDIAWQVYEAGADALIVQDMGLLELDLPPIQLHASTQTDNRSLEKVRFLEGVGFSQIVLARELTLEEIRAIAAQTQATLEFFVHGALCVSYSGQCYISHAQTGRSANRGECSQACRLPYTLADAAGEVLAHDRHLLSLKDNDQSANLAALIEAGIRSFKIEGRLKDLAYVKNVTAWYRQELDRAMQKIPGFRPAASGQCRFLFEPRPEKTFNRGSTDYFVQGRQADIAAFDSPKFAGEPVGTVSALGRGWIELVGGPALNNGDGLTYYGAEGRLDGMRVGRVEGRRLHIGEVPPDLAIGTAMLRNRDQAFMRQLDKPSAERRIAVRLLLADTEDGLHLRLIDADGIEASVSLLCALEPATDPDRALASLREQLGKLGNTQFSAHAIDIQLRQTWFVPVAAINQLRRDAVAALSAARVKAYQRPPRALPAVPPPHYPESALTYLGNVFNRKAREFYARHGVSVIEEAFEAGQTSGEVSLMITRHCLRFSFNLCPKQVKGIRPDPMTLQQGQERLTLRFDCARCEMHVIGKPGKRRSIQIFAQA
jgi:putative protease